MLACVALAGCRCDDCAVGSDYCDGDVLVVCMEDQCHDPGCALGRGNYWSRRPCAAACVEGTEAPFCALSHEQDPGCPVPDAYADPEGTCDGDDIITCKDRFILDRQHCTDTDQVCVLDQQAQPLCALSSTLDPRCPPEERNAAVCAGGVIVNCSGGFARQERPCEDQCVTFDGGFTTCME